MASCFSFSAFLARAFALLVVERTAVATFSITSEVGGFVAGGYAKRLGFAFDTTLNFGISK